MSVCSVCPLSLADLLTIMENRDESFAWNIAVSHGLTKNNVSCPKCSGQMYVTSNYRFVCGMTLWSVTEDFDVEAKECCAELNAKRGTFFEYLQHSVSRILASLYWFLEASSDVRLTGSIVNLPGMTIWNWFSFFTEITLQYCFHNSSVLGGPGRVVDVEGIKLGHRIHNNYYWSIRGKWIFAGVERESGQTFVFVVDDNSEEALIPFIQQWIRPGTTIVSDCWKDFTSLDDFYYIHLTDLCIENPQNIHRSWKSFRKSISAKYQDKSFDAYLSRSLFYFLFPNPHERFHQFLIAAAKLFPPYY